MSYASNFKPYLKRLAIILVASLAFVAVFNELTFRLLKEDFDRPPKAIELVIPAGSAAKVTAGEDIPSIPEEIVFVVGDVLVVRNEDSVDHQLGPIWVPAGSTASLVMDKKENLAYSCSFQTSRYLGLDVRQPTTLQTRLIGLSLAGPTMAALIFIYSLAIRPIRAAEAHKA